jgi:hypothetical protein
MHMLMVFGLEKLLGLPSRNIECQPTLIIGVDYDGVFNSRGYQPRADGLNSLLGWSEHIVNLFRSPMFAKVGRIWMRTSKVLDGGKNVQFA